MRNMVTIMLSRGDIMKNLRSARNSLGLTQQQVADSLGIERPSYARYETGDRQPDVSTLIKLSQLLGVTTDYLLGLTDNPQGHEQPATIAARPTTGMDPISQERLDEIIAEAVKKIREEAGLDKNKRE